MPWKILKKNEVYECKIGDRLACSNDLAAFSGDVDTVIPGKGAWVSNFNGRYFASPDYFQIKKWEEPTPQVN